MARDYSSSPSEGEIIESGSEKANTSTNLIREPAVDSHSRNRISISRSRSPEKSPEPYRPSGPSRDGSRSPFRASTGSKRRPNDDHYDRTRNDPRRFKVRYEDSRQRDRGSGRLAFGGIDRRNNLTQDLPYVDDRRAGGRRQIRFQLEEDDRPSHYRGRSRIDDPSDGGSGPSSNRTCGVHAESRYREGREKPPSKQSVSDRGYNPIATAQTKQNAETNDIQIQHSTSDGVPSFANKSAKYVPTSRTWVCTDETSNSETLEPVSNGADDSVKAAQAQLDEAVLIEERRKKREAIKAKHRGHATPMLVQALKLENTSNPATPKSAAIEESQAQGEDRAKLGRVKTDSCPLESQKQSPPATPNETLGRDSPTNLVVDKDADLANSNAASGAPAQEDEPSAADYDPTMDMQEDRKRHDQHQRDEQVSAINFDETRQPDRDVLLPGDAAIKPLENKADAGFDMFAEGNDLDMFAETATAPKVVEKDKTKAVPVPQAKAIDMSMLDDWDDSEGYYKIILGELLDGRYHVQSNLGKGMFSGVVRATDQKTKRLVAIKVIRNNETMRKAGYKEIDILQALNNADAEDKKHLIRLERCFDHKGHLCMVFENLSINLREVLKKFGRDVGINLKAVRVYAQQMFLGLSLLRKCNVLHADLKPDNVLVNESRNMLKICDLGSASDASENEITQYLVSRFYRAPEIILGMPYDFAIDMWSIGCTLFELYTGKILFTGRSNNQMLRAIMECRGKFTHKILRKAQFAGYHFDDLLNFRSVEKDKLSGKDTIRILNFTKPTRDLKTRLMSNVKGMNDAEIKEVNLFVDLLERCLNLNPEKRCTPNEALKHPFIMRQKV